MNLKFRWIRFKKRLKNRIDKEKPLTETEKKVIKIVSNAIHDNDSIMLMAPISNERFIKYTDDSMHIIMENSRIIISNHKYYYNIILSQIVSDEIHKRFDKVLERKRMEMKKEILEDIEETLEKIVEDTERHKNETEK